MRNDAIHPSSDNRAPQHNSRLSLCKSLLKRTARPDLTVGRAAFHLPTESLQLVSFPAMQQILHAVVLPFLLNVNHLIAHEVIVRREWHVANHT